MMWPNRCAFARDFRDAIGSAGDVSREVRATSAPQSNAASAMRMSSVAMIDRVERSSRAGSVPRRAGATACPRSDGAVFPENGLNPSAPE